MSTLINNIQHIPHSVKVTSDIGVWLVVITGWVGLLQPWLTALATLLAIIWTGLQIYGWIRRKK